MSSDADGARVATETDRRARELGAAMRNAARPYMPVARDVKLDKEDFRLQLRHATSSLSSKHLQRTITARQPRRIRRWYWKG